MRTDPFSWSFWLLYRKWAATISTKPRAMFCWNFSTCVNSASAVRTQKLQYSYDNELQIEHKMAIMVQQQFWRRKGFRVVASRDSIQPIFITIKLVRTCSGFDCCLTAQPTQTLKEDDKLWKKNDRKYKWTTIRERISNIRTPMTAAEPLSPLFTIKQQGKPQWLPAFSSNKGFP